MAKQDRSGFKLDRSYFNRVDKGAVRQRCRGLTPELTATAFPLGLSIDIANSNMFVQGANDYPCKHAFNGGMTKYVQNSPHCKVLYSSRLGWFIDPEDLSVLGLLPEQQPVRLKKEDFLPVLPEIELALTVNQVFGWLKMSG